MASIKEYKQKIKSLVNTRKITKTMKMVAASKLRKAYEAQVHAKNYAQSLTALISRISASVESSVHPLLVAKEKPSRALIVLFTSDSGLCGSFNHNVIGGTEDWVAEYQGVFTKIELACCGKRGAAYFQKTGRIKTVYQNVTARPQFSNAKQIGNNLCQWYQDGDYDEVYLVYNQFFNPLSQKTIIEKIIPINPKDLMHVEKFNQKSDYLFEPKAHELLQFLIPHFIYFKIYFALLENSAGEHGARMSAMDNATKNASDLINRYTLLRNRARQAAITTELIEIVAGAEALKNN